MSTQDPVALPDGNSNDSDSEQSDLPALDDSSNLAETELVTEDTTEEETEQIDEVYEVTIDENQGVSGLH